jgi:DNA-binding NarL/FixJ family response regulator
MRVLLAEDHAIVRQGIRLYLENAGIEVIGEADTGRKAVEMTQALVPDIVIMDIHMPELTGIEATRRIRHDQPDVRILVLTAYDDAAYVHALLEAGADGFVLKTAALPELLRALHDVAAGRVAFTPEQRARAAEHNAALAPMIEGLTVREVDVLTEAAHGRTNKQIGQRLFISDRTVQGHLQAIYQKLGVSTRTEAVTAALSRGLIRLEEGN